MNRLRNYTGLGLCASGVSARRAVRRNPRNKPSYLRVVGWEAATVDARLNHWYIAMHRGEPVRRQSGRTATGLERLLCDRVPLPNLRRERKTGMKRCYAAAMIVVLALAGAASAKAQDVSAADKDRALQYLESTKKGVLDATNGLSDAQWNFKAAPDRWSVAEVMEHLAAAEDMLRGMTQEQVMKTPAVPLRDAEEIKKTDEGVLAMVPDRSHKAQAPEPLKPTNRFGSPAAAQKHFVESRATTEEYLKNTAGLRGHLADSPLGKLDGYEFVLFIAAHSERHTKQMLEVKADPNFPRS